MNTPMIVEMACFTIVACGSGGFLLGVRVQKRRHRTQRELEDAQQVENALLGVVRVDGHVLPIPTVAWKTEDVVFEGTSLPTGIVTRETQTCLVLRPVVVTPRNSVYIDAHSIERTAAIVAYAKSVWIAQQNRRVQDAVKETT